MKQKARRALTKAEFMSGIEIDLMALDSIPGATYIPWMEDQDNDRPLRKRIHKPTDPIQATMRTDARLRSTPFPGETNERF